MLAIYAATALIVAASLLAGAAILALLRWQGSWWLSAATGFAALVVICPFAVRLPGRALTAAIVLGVLLAGCAWVVVRERRRGATAPGDVLRGPGAGRGWAVGVAVAVGVVAAGSLPFLLSDRIGILGEGIYTNDHAAQLYWTEWLREGFGPEPAAVAWGYPVGPPALVAIVAEATGISLVAAFNGLLLAIAALTGLTALAVLGGLSAGRRFVVAALAAMPYLGASFLAQSAFKETAMALFVLAFAILLTASAGSRPGRRELTVGAILAAAPVLTFSLPGLVWFALAIPLWALLEVTAGRRPIDVDRVRAALAAHRTAAVASAVVLVAAIAVTAGPALDFVERIDDVQQSAGRLSSPVFPGEALGIWAEGDFRIVRGEADGALLAVALGAVAAAIGAWALWRRGDSGLLAMLVAGALVYAVARPLAEIHVEAKALAVIAPLVLLVSLRALLGPPQGRAPAPAPAARQPLTAARYALGGLVALAAAGSTFLALRAAPVAPDDRSEGLEQLGGRIQGEPVAFLGVDRFAAHWLRGTLVRAPAGYVPQEIGARPEKTWQQGQAVDFDTLDSAKLDKFDYAITTAAAYGSSPPPSFELVAEAAGYRLYRRTDITQRNRVIERADNPGAVLDCAAPEGRRLSGHVGETLVIAEPVRASYERWRGPAPIEDAAAGQEHAIAAPATLEQTLRLRPGTYSLSLQYHSEAPLAVAAEGGLEAELPPTLDGMYLTGAGRGAFWPLGEIAVPGEPGGAPREVTVRVEADGPSGLRDALGAQDLIWLGDLAASPVAEPRAVSVADACGRYVDRLTLARRAGTGDRPAPDGVDGA